MDKGVMVRPEELFGSSRLVAVVSSLHAPKKSGEGLSLARFLC
jgi:hypothetical protein